MIEKENSNVDFMNSCYDANNADISGVFGNFYKNTNKTKKDNIKRTYMLGIFGVFTDDPFLKSVKHDFKIRPILSTIHWFGVALLNVSLLRAGYLSLDEQKKVKLEKDFISLKNDVKEFLGFEESKKEVFKPGTDKDAEKVRSLKTKKDKVEFSKLKF